MPLGLAAAIAAGLALPAQGRINGALGMRLGDAFAAALTSFGTGLVLMLVAAAVLPSARSGVREILPAVREGRIPWWYVGAGFLGALFVLAQTTAVGILGIAVFTVAVVTGQTVSGLLVDRVGFAQGRRRPLTGMRVIATVLTLAAVALAVAPKFVVSDAAALLALILLPVLAGFFQSFSSAMNGASALAYRSPLTATLVNFISGTAALAVAWGITIAAGGSGSTLPSAPADAWLYAGGALGVAYIALTAVLVRHLGVLVTGLGVIAGQLLGSLALDALVPVAGSAVALPTVVGTLATLAAMVLATLPWNRAQLRGR
ncbi:DMT family transporter [Sinomonas notoginsengisoli]|uniref:DMT family transporter n=1 Tax=Sinomonas notoginsengisoli TaxID=1457311 RepID=UPI001F249FEC|nr:DMT family transporter [Sinomonas notoginsengisoli]